MPPAPHFCNRLKPTANKLLSLSMRKKTTYCEGTCGCKKPNYPYSTKDHQLQAVTRTAFDSFAHSLETICMTQSALQNPRLFRCFIRAQVQRSSEKKPKETRKKHCFLPTREQNTNTELQIKLQSIHKSSRRYKMVTFSAFSIPRDTRSGAAVF